VLGSHGEPVHVHRDGHHDLGATGASIPTQSVGGESRLDPFPLGSSVLEPDFHLLDKVYHELRPLFSIDRLSYLNLTEF